MIDTKITCIHTPPISYIFDQTKSTDANKQTQRNGSAETEAATLSVSVQEMRSINYEFVYFIFITNR